LTNAQVISLVHANKTVGDALYDGLLITVKTQITETLTNVLIPNVLDTSSGSYTIAPSSAVNNAFVYLYATNGVVNDDSISNKYYNGKIPTPITRISDKNSVNSSITATTSPSFVGGETMAVSHTLTNGDIVYMKTDSGDSRDGAQLFNGNTTGGWNYASHGALGGVPMTWVYQFTSGKKYVNQMKFWQAPDSHPSSDITISYYDESTNTWINVTSPDKTGFNERVAPVYAESITINFDGYVSNYWRITAYSHPLSPNPTVVGLYEWEIYGSDDIMTHLAPYATIREVAEIAENDLTLVSGSVFSSITSITKYYVVAFVTSASSGSVVDTATIDETTIATFITSLGTLSTTGYKTLFGATGNNIYYNEDGVAQYEVETIANITVVSAFRTLTPTATDGSEMVDITTTTGFSFSTCVIAVDNTGSVGMHITLPPTINKSILTDYFAIPIDTSLASLMNTNNQWSVVYELKVDSIENAPSFDILSVNDNLQPYPPNYDTHVFGIPSSSKPFLWTPAKRQAQVAIANTVPLNEWVRFGLNKNMYIMIHGDRVERLVHVYYPPYNQPFSSISANTSILIGNGNVSHSSGHWTGNIRNIALFNTNLDFSTDLPVALSTINQTSHPSLVTFFNGGESSTIGHPVTGIMRSSV
jgi:hypothetical protein